MTVPATSPMKIVIAWPNAGIKRSRLSTALRCSVVALGTQLLEQQRELCPPVGAQLKNPAVPIGRRGF